MTKLHVIAQAMGLNFHDTGRDAINVVLGPMAHTDYPNEQFGRIGIALTDTIQNSWCIVFEVASCAIPENVLNPMDLAKSRIGWILDYCKNNYAIMEVPVGLGIRASSPIIWDIEVSTPIKYTYDVRTAVISGSVVFNATPEFVLSSALPIITNLFHAINYNGLTPCHTLSSPV